jgi:hypothetical protein
MCACTYECKCVCISWIRLHLLNRRAHKREQYALDRCTYLLRVDKRTSGYTRSKSLLVLSRENQWSWCVVFRVQ